MRFIKFTGTDFENMAWAQPDSYPVPTNINALDMFAISAVVDPRKKVRRFYSAVTNYVPQGTYGLSCSLVLARYETKVGFIEMLARGFPARTYESTIHLLYDEPDVPTYTPVLRYAARNVSLNDNQSRSMYNVPFVPQIDRATAAPRFFYDIGQMGANRYVINLPNVGMDRGVVSDTGIANLSTSSINVSYVGDMMVSFPSGAAFNLNGCRKMVQSEIEASRITSFFYLQGAGNVPAAQKPSTKHKWYTYLGGEIQEIEPLVDDIYLNFAQLERHLFFM